MSFKVNYQPDHPSLVSTQPPKETDQKETAANQAQDAPGHIRYDKASSRFIVDGEKLTLVELLFKVNSESAVRAKESLAISLQSLQDANADAKEAVEWLNKLRSLTPEGGPDSTVSAGRIDQARQEFQIEHGFNPFEKYNLSDLAKTGGTYKQSEMEKLTEGTKSYMGTVNNNQQAIQLDVERYTHVVTEANQTIASTGKAIADTVASMAAKLS